MTPADVARRRLANQRLNGAPCRTPAEAVAWLAAVQAQDFAGAKWALSLRLAGAGEAALDQAFDEGALLRTHLLRPTWHFVTPADIGWLLALTAPRVHAANAPLYRQTGVDPEVRQRSRAALTQALRGGRPLTRAELRAKLEQAGLEPGDGLRLAYILMAAELDGLLCSGPRRAKQFTYALLEERAPAASTPQREEALAELARRFFLSRGPASAEDLAKWSGLTLGEARRGLAAVQGDLVSEEVEGQVLWSGPAASPARARRPSALLLSIYDEYFSGYKDRRHIATPEAAARLRALGNAATYVLVVDGQIAGAGRRTLSAAEAVVELSLFRPLAPAEDQAVAEALQRFSEFVGRPARLALV